MNNIKKLAVLTALVALTGAECRGAANPRGHCWGPNEVDSGPSESLLYAADSCDIANLNTALANGANIHATKYGEIALIKAARSNCPEIVSRLIEVAQNNHEDVAAFVNTPNFRDGYTALMWAARNGYPNIVRQLLEAGANIDAIQFEEKTALNLAIENNHPEIINMLTRMAKQL